MTPRYGHVEHVSFATSLEAMQLAVHRGEDWQAYDDSLRECARLREQDRRDPAKSLENLAMWAFEDGVDEGCASHDTNPPWSGGRRESTASPGHQRRIRTCAYYLSVEDPPSTVWR